jgi:hypothetical protein
LGEDLQSQFRELVEDPMQRWLGLSIGIAVAGVLVGACTTSTSDKYPSFDSMCTDVAAQECQIADRCLVSKDDCATARKAACLEVANAATAAGRKYDPKSAQGCVDLTQSTYQKALITPADLDKLADTCARVYAGSVDKGGVCQTDYDCSSARVCTHGHCGDKTTKSKGDGCADPGDVCDPSQNIFCQAQTGTSTCAPMAAKGESCNATLPCQPGLRCNITCQDGAAAAQSCGTNADCVSAAPYCDPYAGNICTPGLSFAVGAADCKGYGAAGGGADAGAQDTGSPVDSGAGG